MSRILVAVPHADELAFHCAGTIARTVKAACWTAYFSAFPLHYPHHRDIGLKPRRIGGGEVLT